jgi:hypothetical protein
MGGAKVILLKGTAVIVKSLRNTYLNCVRKCKMHALSFKHIKYLSDKSDAGFRSVCVHARARACV